jgi:hypothetical protein
MNVQTGSHATLTSAPGVLNATSRSLYTLEWCGNFCLGGGVAYRPGLGMCGVSRPPPEFDPLTVHLAVSSSTLYSIGYGCRVQFFLGVIRNAVICLYTDNCCPVWLQFIHWLQYLNNRNHFTFGALQTSLCLARAANGWNSQICIPVIFVPWLLWPTAPHVSPYSFFAGHIWVRPATLCLKKNLSYHSPLAGLCNQKL